MEKEPECFHRDRGKKTGRYTVCKACNSKIKKEKRATDLEWRNKEVQKSAEYRKLYPEKVRVGIRNSTLKAKYGITVGEYNSMFESQGKACAVCGGTESRGYGSMHVDHCHTTGKIRGILCQPCNTSLGKMNDDPVLLRKLADYIENHRKD